MLCLGLSTIYSILLFSLALSFEESRMTDILLIGILTHISLIVGHKPTAQTQIRRHRTLKRNGLIQLITLGNPIQIKLDKPRSAAAEVTKSDMHPYQKGNK